jgi:hypothetical protein
MESTMSAAAKKAPENKPAVAAPRAYTIVKRTKSRWWEVRDAVGDLVCLTVYKRGAEEVVRRLNV